MLTEHCGGYWLAVLTFFPYHLPFILVLLFLEEAVVKFFFAARAHQTIIYYYYCVLLLMPDCVCCVLLCQNLPKLPIVGHSYSYSNYYYYGRESMTSQMKPGRRVCGLVSSKIEKLRGST